MSNTSMNKIWTEKLQKPVCIISTLKKITIHTKYIYSRKHITQSGKKYW